MLYRGDTSESDFNEFSRNYIFPNLDYNINEFDKQNSKKIKEYDIAQNARIRFEISGLDLEKSRYIKFPKPGTLIEKEKNKTLKRKREGEHCAKLFYIEGYSHSSHIIPKDSYCFLERLNIRKDYLDMRLGDNIIETTPDFHGYMELKNIGIDKEKMDKENNSEKIKYDKVDDPEKDPLFTILPIKYYNINSCKSEFISALEKLKIIDKNKNNYHYLGDDMIAIWDPNPPPSKNSAVRDIANKFISNEIGETSNIESGSLWWMIHSCWTLALWSGIYFPEPE